MKMFRRRHRFGDEQRAEFLKIRRLTTLPAPLMFDEHEILPSRAAPAALAAEEIAGDESGDVSLSSGRGSFEAVGEYHGDQSAKASMTGLMSSIIG